MTRAAEARAHGGTLRARQALVQIAARTCCKDNVLVFAFFFPPKKEKFLLAFPPELAENGLC